jgi:hypothetical protein
MPRGHRRARDRSARWAQRRWLEWRVEIGPARSEPPIPIMPSLAMCGSPAGAAPSHICLTDCAYGGGYGGPAWDYYRSQRARRDMLEAPSVAGSQGVRGSNPLSSTRAPGAPPPEFIQVRRGFLRLVSILWWQFVWLLRGPSGANLEHGVGGREMGSRSAPAPQRSTCRFGACPSRLEIGCRAVVAVALEWMGGSSRGHPRGGEGLARSPPVRLIYLLAGPVGC